MCIASAASGPSSCGSMPPGVTWDGRPLSAPPAAAAATTAAATTAAAATTDIRILAREMYNKGPIDDWFRLLKALSARRSHVNNNSNDELHGFVVFDNPTVVDPTTDL